MKKALNLLLYTLCVTITLYLVSCSKDEGAQGPAGPAGAAGPAGPAGGVGPAGPAGTANVIYSPWIDTLRFLPFTDTVGGIVDTVGYYCDISAPKVDLDMLNKGEIKVYVNVGEVSDPFVYPIPFNNGFVFIDVSFFLGTIELVSNAPLLGVPFRYILIPGGTPARSAKSIDWNDYKQVQKYLGLKD
jgi:hypothetical protein